MKAITTQALILIVLLTMFLTLSIPSIIQEIRTNVTTTTIQDELKCQTDQDCPQIYCVRSPCPYYECVGGVCKIMIPETTTTTTKVQKILRVDSIANNKDSYLNQRITVNGIASQSTEVRCTLRECIEADSCCQGCWSPLLLADPYIKSDLITISGVYNNKGVGCSGTNCGLNCYPLNDEKRYLVTGVWTKGGNSYQLQLESFIDFDAAKQCSSDNGCVLQSTDYCCGREAINKKYSWGMHQVCAVECPKYSVYCVNSVCQMV